MFKFTDSALAKLENDPSRQQEFSDSVIRGLRLRISYQGSRSFYLTYKFEARVRKYKIGPLSIGVTEARKIAKKLLGEIAHGIDPFAVRQAANKEAVKQRNNTLRKYLEDQYFPYIDKNLKSANPTRRVLKRSLAKYMDKSLNAINKKAIDKWVQGELSRGIQKSTINRALISIRSMLSTAVKWEVLPENPLKDYKLLKTDSEGVVRWLDNHEEQRLLQILDARDDYVKVYVNIILNTGMRPNEVRLLKWSDVAFVLKQIAVRGSNTKSGKVRHLPVNENLLPILRDWRDRNQTDEWVFPAMGSRGCPVPEDRPIHALEWHTWTRILEEAQIKNFRLYDCRHTFASKLAMKGVSLYTISKLLGHSKVEMTKIYAHLSGDHLESAVNLLNDPTTVA